jgi:hypothetical protein
MRIRCLVWDWGNFPPSDEQSAVRGGGCVTLVCSRIKQRMTEDKK